MLPWPYFVAYPTAIYYGLQEETVVYDGIRRDRKTFPCYLNHSKRPKQSKLASLMESIRTTHSWDHGFSEKKFRTFMDLIQANSQLQSSHNTTN